MRRTEQSMERANALASMVLPDVFDQEVSLGQQGHEGGRTTSVLPSMTRSMLVRILSKEAATSSMPPVSGRVVATEANSFLGTELPDCRRRR